MAHYGNLGNQRVAEEVRDVRGTTIRTFDGQKLGTVDDVIFNHDSMEICYVVVDSGGWLEAGTFLLPSNRLSADESHADGLAADATQKQIQKSPQFDKNSPPSDEWGEYEQKFKEYWEEQPVMHLKGSDRIITPPEEREPAQGRSTARATAPGNRELSAAELFPKRMTNVFTGPEPGSGKVTLRPEPVVLAEQAAAGVNQLKPRWWEAFENYLRINKGDIQGKCPQCSSRAA